MTNQEARGILANLEADYRDLDPLVLTNDSIRLVNKRIEALGMAISALRVQDGTDINVASMISRQAAIDALDGKIEITGRTNAEAVKGYVRLVKDRLERLPSAQPEQHEIGYSECANAMLKMWIDKVLTDGEYNRIMDKLNAYWEERRTDD